jgi:hypothetical protein
MTNLQIQEELIKLKASQDALVHMVLYPEGKIGRAWDPFPIMPRLKYEKSDGYKINSYVLPQSIGFHARFKVCDDKTYIEMKEPNRKFVLYDGKLQEQFGDFPCLEDIEWN